MNKVEVARLLKVSPGTIDAMVAEGRFPAGIKLTPKTAPIWTGADLAAWLHLAARMGPQKIEAGEEN